ncbi:patatin-like phospholipase family protein [Poseidonocella sedimentorum]|uniref:NTE family protein n=1 Tax=Poseidonocella sedimentorum TaxID=871652 RepID=A0A1I6DG27_9RHOB|nr:patatin-like phospholipase family protein [Poseidonocella sedimentorum]SFR04440.1 NTE family protein [Poseidonocella sedimentorum]
MVEINLGLQGGGAHGAFTWGVLDRLLSEPDLHIAAISGTSAGALNAAALKSGYLQGGAEGARENLAWFWHEVASLDNFALPDWLQPFMPPISVLSKNIEYSPAFAAADAASRMFSPYAWGPFYTHPLHRIVEQFNFGRVCADEGPELFISATNVRSGRGRVFKGEEITAASLLASACLPTLYQAVEIEDPATGMMEAYWDGGYIGNPTLYPLYSGDLPRDIVIVNINPIVRDRIPNTPQEIQNRINEISFNSALLQDLRTIHYAQSLKDREDIPDAAMKDLHVHMIADDKLMNQLSVATKMVPNPLIMEDLKAAGQRAASTFLAQNKSKIGVESTIDLGAMFG